METDEFMRNNVGQAKAIRSWADGLGSRKNSSTSLTAKGMQTATRCAAIVLFAAIASFAVVSLAVDTFVCGDADRCFRDHSTCDSSQSTLNTRVGGLPQPSSCHNS